MKSYLNISIRVSPNELSLLKVLFWVLLLRCMASSYSLLSNISRISNRGNKGLMWVLVLRVGQHPCHGELGTTSAMVESSLWSHE